MALPTTWRAWKGHPKLKIVEMSSKSKDSHIRYVIDPQIPRHAVDCCSPCDYICRDVAMRFWKSGQGKTTLFKIYLTRELLNQNHSLD